MTDGDATASARYAVGRGGAVPSRVAACQRSPACACTARPLLNATSVTSVKLEQCSGAARIINYDEQVNQCRLSLALLTSHELK